MISKNLLKQIASYKQKKYRQEDKVFVVEGEKCVNELLHSDFEIVYLCATKKWFQRGIYSDKFIEVTEKELERISNLTTPDKVLAVVKQKESKRIEIKDELYIALDCINNPGNLGTIIRLATWFGIKNIICNKESAECYNPKVVQASMGAIFRVNIFYTELDKFINTIDKDFPIYCTVIEGGQNIYNAELTKKGLIIIGNESRGINSELRKRINRPITIPNFSENKEIESLNASIASAIVLSEFKRRV
ncbi:MAG: RNA methyltransferase [Bacteroidales bacterium]|nr:RNA methyltransferase [Bacteroidales bacterium]